MTALIRRLRRPLRGEVGTSLPEIMMALAVSSILMVGVSTYASGIFSGQTRDRTQTLADSQWSFLSASISRSLVGSPAAPATSVSFVGTPTPEQFEVQITTSSSASNYPGQIICLKYAVASTGVSGFYSVTRQFGGPPDSGFDCTESSMTWWTTTTLASDIGGYTTPTTSGSSTATACSSAATCQVFAYRCQDGTLAVGGATCSGGYGSVIISPTFGQLGTSYSSPYSPSVEVPLS